MNRKLRILDGFLIRAYALVFGIAVGTASTLAAPSIPQILWNRGTQACVSMIPLPVRPLSFRCTFLACGTQGNGRGYEASDGAQLLSWACGFGSAGEAQSSMQSQLAETPTIVERGGVEEDGCVVGEWILAANERGAVMVRRTGTEVLSVSGPTPRHVEQLVAQVCYP
jgi:hypothetical protein